MTRREKRIALAAIVRAPANTLNGMPVLVSDRLEAIRLDNWLAGHGSQARLHRTVSRFLAKFQK